jgi:hypothetical protein
LRSTLFRSAAAFSIVLIAGLVSPASPANAALTCGPDAYEQDSYATAAPLTAGATTTRSICQSPTPEPGATSKRDDDYFGFTATGDTAYTVQAVDVGAALVNDAYDRGGLELAVRRLNADGTTTVIEQNRQANGDRVITPVLPAGKYLIFANTNATQVYPETNTMDVKTVQGSEGTYAVRLAESTPPPVVSSFTLSSSTVRDGSSVTGTYTLSAPAPSGGMYVDVKSSSIYNAYPGPTYAPAGANRVSFKITGRNGSSDVRVTLTAWARVGASKSVVLTVRR